MKNSVIAFFCIVFLLSCADDNTTHNNHQSKAPDFRLEDIRHQRFYLNQHAGKIVVIVFWATWCQVCKEYLNALEKIYPDLKAKQIELVSIVVDPENRDTLSELLKTSVDVSYPVLLDRKSLVMEKYKITKIPTTLIIGQATAIVMKKEGYTHSTVSQIRNKLNLLMEKDK